VTSRNHNSDLKSIIAEICSIRQYLLTLIESANEVDDRLGDLAANIIDMGDQ